MSPKCWPARKKTSVQIQSMHFKARASGALADAQLQRGLARVDGFATRRAQVMVELEDLQGMRTAAAGIRDRVLDNLDVWIERFEREATRRGATVLYA